MNRILFLMLVMSVATIGCRKAKPTATPATTTPNNPAEAYARKVPVIDRTLSMKDFKNLHLALEAYRSNAGGGKWPKSKDELLFILKQDPDLRTIIPKVEDGSYIVIYNPIDGGILAHTGGSDMHGVVTVTTSGDVRNMTAGEFREVMAQQKR